MSLTSLGEGRTGPARVKVTIHTIQEKKLRREPVTCLTAYDYATSRLVDEAEEARSRTRRAPQTVSRGSA